MFKSILSRWAGIKWVGWIAGVLFFIEFIFYFYHVPFNMDEFLHYQPIACHDYPLNHLNVFRSGCQEFDLAVIPGHYWPLRCYAYMGSFQSALYYPLFKIWASPYSARCMGLIMLLIQAWLIKRIFGVRMRFAFIGLLLFFPYAFKHVVDTGPVSFQTTSVFLVCYLARKWQEALCGPQRSSWGFPVAIGIIIFCCLWTKPVYFAILPGVMVAGGYVFMTRIGKPFMPSWRLWRDLALLALCAVVPLTVLFNAVDLMGRKYQYVLSLGKAIPLFQGNLLWRHWNELYQYFANPVQAAHSVFAIQAKVTWVGIAFILMVVAFIGLGLWRVRSEPRVFYFSIFNSVLFVVSMVSLLHYNTVVNMHHIILIFPFLIMAVVALMARLQGARLVYTFCLAFALFNASFYYSAMRGKPLTMCHSSLNQFNEYLNKKYANEYVFVIVDWGMYYLKSLYGAKEQCVLYLDPFDNMIAVNALKRVLFQTQRKPMFIGRIDHQSEIARHLTEVKTDFDTGPWRAWY